MYECYWGFYIPSVCGVEIVKAKVDTDECTGCALCVDTCPEVFEMVGDLAVTKQGEVPSGAEETCIQAVEDCPVEAIRIDR
tara:strand:+ start:270 stop:512 length:243 start_codon:yes stop_codon:yes gene_type:complete